MDGAEVGLGGQKVHFLQDLAIEGLDPAAGLLVVSIGSLGHLLHPVVLEVGVAGVLRTVQ